MKIIGIIILLLSLNMQISNEIKLNTYIPQPEKITVIKYPNNMNRHNPFNIRRNDANNWLGKAKLDDNFETFTEVEYGIRAGFVLLRNYYTKYGLNTIEGIVNRFAPPVENDTDNYINVVCKLTGYNKDQILDLYDKDTLLKLTAAMIYMEQGKHISPLEDVYQKYFT